MTRPSTLVRAAVTTLAVVAAAFGVVATAAPASADTGASCSQVYLGPKPTTGSTASYFTVHAAASTTSTEHLVAANPASIECTVVLSRAVGRTAVNSGDTYVTAAHGVGCTTTACWIDGLPASVRVPARSRVVVPFTVTVPAGTGAGEYLGGVVGEPAASGTASNADSQVAVHVANRVAIGVAVTVPGALDPHVSIPDVRVDAKLSTLAATVQITEQNTGNTWEHPKGALRVHVGSKVLRVPVTSNTLLAGGTATLAAALSSVPAGTYDADVTLDYAGAHAATWRGRLTFPVPPKVTRAGNVITVTQTSTGMPIWAYATIGGLGLVLIVLVALLVATARRRRREPAAR